MAAQRARARDESRSPSTSGAGGSAGRAASSRGVHGRIEEHGLHVWLGYYDNAFRLMREVYDELDRPTTDPECPIADLARRVRPAGRVGRRGPRGGRLAALGRDLRPNDQRAGAPTRPGAPLSVAAFVRSGRCGCCSTSRVVAAADERRVPAGVVLSASPEPPPARERRSPAGRRSACCARREIAAMVAAVEAIRLLEAALPRGGPLAATVARVPRGHARGLGARSARRRRRPPACRARRPRGHLLPGRHPRRAARDPRLRAPSTTRTSATGSRRHGARPETLESPLVRGMYDLVFAYEDGDPRSAAVLRRAGPVPGRQDVLRLPGIDLLADAGRAWATSCSPPSTRRCGRAGCGSRSSTGSTDCASSATAARSTPSPRARRGWPRRDDYDPLMRVERAALLPSAPLAEQLADHARPGPRVRTGLIAAPRSAGPARRRGLRRRRARHVARHGPIVLPELIERSPRWRAMVDHVATVATQSLQLWLRRRESELGLAASGRDGQRLRARRSTPTPSMTPPARARGWAARTAPGDARLLLRRAAGAAPTADPQAAERRRARQRGRASSTPLRRHFWPARRARRGFRWDLLCGEGDGGGERTAGQPVLDAPTSTRPTATCSRCRAARPRLRADESGYDNLVLAGDWTNCGLNAGCIEAAVMAGTAGGQRGARAPLDGRRSAEPGTASRTHDRRRSASRQPLRPPAARHRDAMEVFDRLIEELTARRPSTAGRHVISTARIATMTGAGPTDLPQLRAAVARTIDVYADLFRHTLELYADVVESAAVKRRGRVRRRRQRGGVALAASPGAEAVAVVWIHNTTHRAGRPCAAPDRSHGARRRTDHRLGRRLLPAAPGCRAPRAAGSRRCRALPARGRPRHLPRARAGDGLPPRLAVASVVAS